VIRNFEEWDMERARMVHEENGLDPRCFPNLTIKTPAGEEPNPLFISKQIYQVDGASALFCFLKITSELYLLVDHNIGTPEQRWEWLKEFKEHMKREAWKRGLEQMTAFVPTDIEESFAKRLLDLGFVRSPWQSYTLNLED
jgi:hypothetical protein